MTDDLNIGDAVLEALRVSQTEFVVGEVRSGDVTDAAGDDPGETEGGE